MGKGACLACSLCSASYVAKGLLRMGDCPSAATSCFLCSLDADIWKKFLSRPALPFILRLLRGLATQHPATQVRGKPS